MVPNMAPSRLMGGLTQSSASSGIFFQGDGQSQNFINSHMSSSFGNSANSIPGTGRPNLGPVSGDINQAVLNSVANSASSIGASSLVTDANSAFSGGPQLQRSASINTESYMRLPASPMSFTSNNISISGSSAMDGSSAIQQNSHHDSISQHLNQHGALGATSMPASQMGQIPIPMPSRIPNTLIQDPTSLSHAQKKPRLDIKQEDFVQQQVIQQMLQRGDPMQLQSHNPQLQAFIQQQRLRQQQQQMMQAMPQMQRAQLQQQQLRQQLQQQNMQQMAVMKNPQESGGICARRLMQYLFHQRKPTENTISYWRSFVKEYYAPRAKKRWCLSQYENVAHQGFGVFPQAAMDAWHCDICGSKSGKGFEAIYEVLPRLNEIKFSSGVIDELLFLDVPRERRSVTGVMMLEYEKAVQETVYEQVRIIREGHLRIIFTQELKILSWEFCARRHEELLPRRIVTSQVNQLLQVAQKCQSTTNGSGSEGVSTQELQSNSNMMVTAGRQLAKSLELQSLNDLGFSKRYVRCLQIAEVVNSMKDLMAFCRESKAGPIEGLKNYPRHNTLSTSTSNLQLQKMQEIEQLASMQGMPTDRNTLNKLMAMQQLGINNNNNNNNNNNPPNMAGSGSGAPSGPTASGLPLTNCQQSMLTRQSSINSNPGSHHQEASSSLNNPSPSSSFQGPSPAPVGGSVGGFSSPQQQQQQQQQRTNCGNAVRCGQTLQQQMIQQLLHEMSNNNRAGVPQPGQPGQQQKTLVGLGGFGSPAPGGGSMGPTLTKCNSFKMTANSGDSSAAAPAGGGFNAPRVSVSGGDMSQNQHLADEMVQELTNDVTDGGFFSSNLDDALGYSWKA